MRKGNFITRAGLLLIISVGRRVLLLCGASRKTIKSRSNK